MLRTAVREKPCPEQPPRAPEELLRVPWGNGAPPALAEPFVRPGYATSFETSSMKV